MNRRALLGRGAAGLSFVTLGGSMPGLFASAARASRLADQNDHVLVVLELSGGNDGLNTVVPFEDPLYYKNRRKLGLAKDQVHQLNDQVGLHPSLEALANRFKNGELAIVQGVGYPRPDRSHFRSMEIWQTASVETVPPGTGWLGRCLDATEPGESDLRARGMALTGSLPPAFQAAKVNLAVVSQGFATDIDATAFGQLRRKLSIGPTTPGPLGYLRRQAAAADRTTEQIQKAVQSYKSTVNYPDGDLGQQLKRASQMIAGRMGVRILYANQDGYDTHAAQLETHAELLTELSAALDAFQQDLAAQGLADKVVVMIFSEFGRRVDENASAGTDHGAASNLFLLGTKVQGGFSGKYPSLSDLGEGDLIFNTDFRSVYASLLDGWLGCPSEITLGQKFAALPLFRS